MTKFFGTGLISGGLSAVLSKISASRVSDAIKESAEQQFLAISDYVTQARVDRILNTEKLARDARVALGEALNVAPDGLSARETIASRIVAGVSSDQWAINEERRRRETAARGQMLAVKISANNQLAGVAAGVGNAFTQGFGAGTALYSAASQHRDSQRILGQQEQIHEQQTTHQGLDTDAMTMHRDTTALELQHFLGVLDDMRERNASALASPAVQSALQQTFAPSYLELAKRFTGGQQY